jgi:hypothetical protein
LGSPIFSDFNTGFTGSEASMLGLPLSAGGGAGALSLSTLPAGGSNIGGSGGGFFGSVLKGISSLLPIGALAGGAALLGRGGIAGALGSGALGFGAGVLAGPLLTGLAESAFLSGSIGMGLATTLATVGSFLGPIGAGIGLIAGLVSLFTGRGKRKIHQTQVLQDEQHQLDLLQRAYDLHQIDYNSAIGQAEQLRQSYTQQQEQIQKGGSAGRVDPWINALESHIYQEEQQRQNALAASAHYGPPQFRFGGYVDASLARALPNFRPAMHFAMGGAVPAMLHAGEFVMRPEAVQRLGRARLEAQNAGSGGGTHVHLTINALDGKSVEELFEPGGDAFRGIARNIQRAVAEGRF